MSNRFCYWSVADGSHGVMAKTMIASARAVGVTEDFHIWSDKDIPGAITHITKPFDKHKYLFKLKFLKEEVSKLDYDYFVFLDADNYFVRHPGSYQDILKDNKVFVQMENDCTSKDLKRGDWWGCPIQWYPILMKYKGVKTLSGKIYNTNAGFWIVRKEHITEFVNKCMDFWYCAKHEAKVEFTEEAPIAYAGHMMMKIPEEAYLDYNSHIWCCDWIGNYKDQIPDGKEWFFEDYMTGEKKKVNPAIIHAMRSKDAMIKAANDNNN